MALGLFSSLLIGSILNTLGMKLGIPLFSETLWPIAKQMTGPAIGVAIAYALKAPPLVLFSATTAGAAGAALGGPVGAYIASVAATECGKLVANETKIDILLTPAVTVVVGVIVGTLVGPQVGALMTALGDLIMYATQLQPLLMGMIVAVLMGMALTLPISSAAIAIMLSLNGLAAGAATVGCCAQMVGFAVMSFRENRWAGVVAQGLGTSMLQMPNIVKNHKVWYPPILASAILGPIATLVFAMENTPLGAGMGTSGFVGQIQSIIALDAAGWSSGEIYTAVLMMHLILPAVITLVIAEVMRKAGWIKPGDLTLNLTSK
ncbi:PTS sugar transporter subunit IIC [Photobacterium sp. OFAV2-7]|nr:PTS sugar transporter subunit IIC [Photobacterium sp. OFAV2-7]